MAKQDSAPQQQRDEHRLVEERRRKLQQWRAQGAAYPNDFRPRHKAQWVQDQYREQSREQLAEEQLELQLAGRVVRDRGAFLVLQDDSGQLQLYVDRKALQAPLLEHIRSWDLGDIVAVRGDLHRSQRGDLYLAIAEARLLAKALRPLPDKYHGLEDREARYRRRYLDLIANPAARTVFRRRSQIVAQLRRSLEERDFLEVETPMMQQLPGGASARPFVTHHQALDLQLFLRIAPELFLKRLVVGGMERVFELNRNFRNEGLSTRHNPEFTMLEFYQAHASYTDMMRLMELLLREVAQQVLGKSSFLWQGRNFDVGRDFARLSMADAVLEHHPELRSQCLGDAERLLRYVRQQGLEPKAGDSAGQLLALLFEKTVEERLEGPVFISDYPVEVSPLARSRDDNPLFTERFDLIIAGQEIGNGFSELNDPEEQARRFRKQVQARDAGDAEAMYYDADYIRALEYGLPPTGGAGLGVDRLVMLLTDQPAIRDVLLFPLLRPRAAAD